MPSAMRNNDQNFFLFSFKRYTNPNSGYNLRNEANKKTGSAKVLDE
jgi:hypothetical protein